MLLPSARRAYRQGWRWSWMSADGLKSLRAVVFVFGAGLQQEKWRQDLLELAKRPAWFLFFASDCFEQKRALVAKAQSRLGDAFVGGLGGLMATSARWRRS